MPPPARPDSPVCRRILPRRLKRRLAAADATVGLEEDSTSERTSTAALIEACHAAALTPPVPGEPVGTIDAILDRLDAAGEGALWSVFLLDHGRLWAIAQRGYTMLPDGLPLDRGVVSDCATPTISPPTTAPSVTVESAERGRGEREDEDRLHRRGA